MHSPDILTNERTRSIRSLIRGWTATKCRRDQTFAPHHAPIPSGEHVVRILHLRDALAAAVLQLSVWTFFHCEQIKVSHHAVMVIKARHAHRPVNPDLAQRVDESVLILHTSLDVLERL